MTDSTNEILNNMFNVRLLCKGAVTRDGKVTLYRKSKANVANDRT